MTEIELKFYHLACSFFAKNAKDESKEIDWEQRRYEIAKSALEGCLSGRSCGSTQYSFLANRCVKIADALIEELKKT